MIETPLCDTQQAIIPSEMTPDEQYNANEPYVPLHFARSLERRLRELERAVEDAIKRASTVPYGSKGHRCEYRVLLEAIRDSLKSRVAREG